MCKVVEHRTVSSALDVQLRRMTQKITCHHFVVIYDVLVRFNLLSHRTWTQSRQHALFVYRNPSLERSEEDVLSLQQLACLA